MHRFGRGGGRRISEDATVTIKAIGEKKGDKLIIGGEEFDL